MTIIAGYSGIGKSYFCEKMENSIDLHSMPHKWILPTVYNDEEKETVKAAPYLISNPNYKTDYVKAIIDASKKYDYVVIPSDLYVLKELDKLGIPFILVYPELSLKEQYRKRYLARGNMWYFIEVFIEQWEERILSLITYPSKYKIVLKQEEYLLDFQDKLFIFTNNQKIDNCIDNAIKTLNINETNKNRWLYLCDDTDYSTKLIKIDLNNQYHKDTVFQIGKVFNDLGLLKPIWIEDEALECFIKYDENYKIFNDIQELNFYLQELQTRLKKRNEEYEKILKKTEEDLENGTLKSISFDEFKEKQYIKTIAYYQKLLSDKERNG